ncbi:hypothetical protein MYCTH_103818 [Thermothelomyces thermophilus ATCC 42464]|uniref:Uncharacterized protein n=1 Tax=Thermothelomyces thermophilus (strain ATCC 42464 / BCRC 31852 / DSM 1799) TaxID=573729 RepID=G2QNW4_THET4|nr:uncharacterized protein MYCTH_103818 [Thermothelomyces thermophilus ATCC 42464]AEO62140.1 hypothetical protein MYCTH_103818 [Thermothelomyces thermophilus ATCC 42464]
MQEIKNTLAENFGGPVTALGSHQFKLVDCPDLTGKVAVVTGGVKVSALVWFNYTFLKHSINKVYTLSVAEEVINGAKEVVARELGQDKADRIVFLQCDLSDWLRVKEIAETIKHDTDRLDNLVNNAGRGIMTAELTSCKKKNAERGNIVRISSQASNMHHKVPSDIKFASLEEINTDLGRNQLYSRSKLAVILYKRYYFDRRVTRNGHLNLLMNATHPGFVSSKQSRADIFEAFPIGGFGMSYGPEPFKKDEFEGAVPTVYAATVADKGGQHICAPATPEAGSELSQSEELAERLMELTRNVVRERRWGANRPVAMQTEKGDAGREPGL